MKKQICGYPRLKQMIVELCQHCLKFEELSNIRISIQVAKTNKEAQLSMVTHTCNPNIWQTEATQKTSLCYMRACFQINISNKKYINAQKRKDCSQETNLVEGQKPNGKSHKHQVELLDTPTNPRGRPRLEQEIGPSERRERPLASYKSAERSTGKTDHVMTVMRSRKPLLFQTGQKLAAALINDLEEVLFFCVFVPEIEPRDLNLFFH